MKILILGATGATGRLIVGTAVAKGYEVVALVRSKAKAADLIGAELVEGDARDPAALTRAIAGCDAVISSLGTPMSPFREVTLLSKATRALVSVMEQQNVQRLVCITGLGAGDSRGHGGLFFDRLFLPLMLRRSMKIRIARKMPSAPARSTGPSFDQRCSTTSQRAAASRR